MEIKAIEKVVELGELHYSPPLFIDLESWKSGLIHSPAKGTS